MIKAISKVDDFEVIECSGWDAVRGIIGREEILESNVLVFRDCPVVHSFLVRDSFWTTWLNLDGTKIAEEKIFPNSFSGFYKFRAICLESLHQLEATFLIKVIAALHKKL